MAYAISECQILETCMILVDEAYVAQANSLTNSTSQLTASIVCSKVHYNSLSSFQTSGRVLKIQKNGSHCGDSADLHLLDKHSAY
jgi:hypothetical protein